MKNMANAAKAKGKGFEREVSDLFRKVTGLNFQRVPNSGAFIGGKNVERISTMSNNQIQLSRGDIIPPEEFAGICIECKFHKDFCFHQLFDSSKEVEAWIDQCMIDYKRTNGKFFAVIFKVNRKGMFICTLPEQINDMQGLDYKHKDGTFFRISMFDEAFLKKYIDRIKVLCDGILESQPSEKVEITNEILKTS
jgi:Holliday junction resolvase